MLNSQLPQGFSMPQFQWDQGKTSDKLRLSDDRLEVIAIDGSGFKSAIGDCEFAPGYKYFFELRILKGSLIKIGVCTASAMFQDQAFSDTAEGWAIYNGELRHNSNSSGKKYGTNYKAGDVIGVFLDMIEEGSLGFVLNGQYLGVAFEDERLKSVPLYAAIAPIYKDDGIALNMTIRED